MLQYSIYVDLFGNGREELYYTYHTNSIASANALFDHFLAVGFQTIILYNDDDTLRKVKDGVEVDAGKKTRSC